MYKKCKICDANYSFVSQKLELVKCSNCSLVFCNKIFSQEEITEIYNYLYNQKVKSHYNFHTDLQYKTLLKGEMPKIGFNRKRLIDNSIKDKNIKVLEIGSGIGLIGSYLKTKNVLNYTGLEIDNKTCQKSKKLGLNTLNVDFSYMNDMNENFNVIMMWEVLEHIQNLKLFLELAFKKLEKNGLLMFSVPNFNKVKNYKINKQEIVRIYQDEPPIHLNFFTKKSIESVLNLSGFSIESLHVKKTPFLNFKKKHFYKMLLKAIAGNYEGSTIYVSARKQ